MTNIAHNWLANVQTVATKIFNDTTALYGLVKDGQMYGPNQGSQNTAIASTDTITQALFASIAGVTWTTGTDTSMPFSEYCAYNPSR